MPCFATPNAFQDSVAHRKSDSLPYQTRSETTRRSQNASFCRTNRASRQPNRHKMPYFAVPNALRDTLTQRKCLILPYQTHFETLPGNAQNPPKNRLYANWPELAIPVLFRSEKRHFFDAENFPENVDRAATLRHTRIALFCRTKRARRRAGA